MKNHTTSRIILIFMMIAVCLPAALRAQSFKKGPYLVYDNVNTRMKVLWQNTASSSDALSWGTDLSYSLGTVNVAPYGTDYQHAYTIPGLAPGILYYYKVTVGTVTKTGSFYAAPPTDATSVKFLAYGDTRTYPNYHDNVAQQILSSYTQGYQGVLISMGDLVADGNTESYWTSEFFNYSYPNIQEMLATMPYQCAMGNHEGTGVLFQKYFPYQYAGGRYYSFDYGPVHFTVVDQYTTYTAGSAQYNWIVNDLSTTTKPWKVMYFHEPGWSAGGGHANNTTVQSVLEPLCEQYGVSIVLAGHNHYYARAEVPTAAGGIIQHVTAGAAGAPLATGNPSNPYIVKYESVYHFCKINVLNNEYLEFAAIRSDGSLLDQFTINRAVVINNVQASNITGNSALITWTTDKSSTSTVEYGTTTAYGSVASGASGTSHSVTLTGLTSNSLYHYRVKSNYTYSGDYTFTTANPPIVTYLSPTSVTKIQGTIVSGDHTNLATNNNTGYLTVNSTTAKNRICDWYGSFTGVPVTTTKLTFTYDGKYSRSQTQTLYLYNWNISGWVQTDLRTVSTKDVTITWSTSSPAAFVSPGGEVKLRVYSTSNSKNFTCYGDYMQLAVETGGGLPSGGGILADDFPIPGDLNHFIFYPNPTSGRATLQFRLDQPATVTVSLFDLNGSKTASLVTDDNRTSGVHEVPVSLEMIPAGIYLAVFSIKDSEGNLVTRTLRVVVAK